MTTQDPTAPRTSSKSQEDISDAQSACLLSILLVNYNGIKFLGPCLDSVLQFAPPQTQVILVDNASTDGSADFVETAYPRATVVRSDRNLGFARGNNLAAGRAQGRFILLLNTDTVLLEPIKPTIEWLEANPSCGALTINMLDGDRIARACTGRFPSVVRLSALRSMLVDPGCYDGQDAYDVDWVQGSFLLVRSTVWHALKGLDGRYFMYAEDVDICKRIWNAGFRCSYLPKWSYLHWGGFKLDRFPEQIRSLDIYVDLHMGTFNRLLCRVVLLAGCLVRAFFYRGRAMLNASEIDRRRGLVSWRAFKTLLQQQRSATD